jgi:hypothetical protein
MRTKANRYHIELRALKHEVDELARLKRLLKAALRQFGFRCVRIEKSK